MAFVYRVGGICQLHQTIICLFVPQKSEESKDEKKEKNIVIINNYNALRNADNELVARALFDVLDNAQIAKIIGRVDNEEVLQQRAKEFKLNRSIIDLWNLSGRIRLEFECSEPMMECI